MQLAQMHPSHLGGIKERTDLETKMGIYVVYVHCTTMYDCGSGQTDCLNSRSNVLIGKRDGKLTSCQDDVFFPEVLLMRRNFKHPGLISSVIVLVELGTGRNKLF